MENFDIGSLKPGNKLSYIVVGLTFKHLFSFDELRQGIYFHELEGDVLGDWEESKKLLDKNESLNEYNIQLIEHPAKNKYDAIVFAVAHDQFRDFSSNEIMAFGKDKHVIYDIKYLLNINEVDGRL